MWRLLFGTLSVQQTWLVLRMYVLQIKAADAAAARNAAAGTAAADLPDGVLAQLTGLATASPIPSTTLPLQTSVAASGPGRPLVQEVDG